MPKFIGHYKVTQSHLEISRYTLDLLQELKAQKIIPSFHISLLCLYHKSDDTLFPKWKLRTFYDFGNAKNNEWLADDIIAHKWEENNISFFVQWNLGDTTWKLYIECKELTALDWYLEVLGINNGGWKKLPPKQWVSEHWCTEAVQDLKEDLKSPRVW